MSEITINNTKIYYKLYRAEGARETVAFFNGVMDSASSWEHYIRVFRNAGYNVLTHDFRGQALSGKPKGPYTFSRHAEDVKTILDTLGIQKPHLVGASYGGEVAMRCAIDYPEMPQTITLIDSVSETDEIVDGFMNLWIQMASNDDPYKFFWGVASTIYSDPFIRNNREKLDKQAERMKKLPRDYFTGQIYLYQTFKQDVRMTEDLSTITCPALVICGENDMLHPVAFSRKIARGIPHAESVIIPESGHATIFEQPNVVTSVLLGFIGKSPVS